MKMGKLDYSISREEGFVKINWNVMPTGVVMLDVLKDWIVELEGIYETKREEVFKQGKQIETTEETQNGQ
jgi:hypothetical protein